MRNVNNCKCLLCISKLRRRQPTIDSHYELNLHPRDWFVRICRSLALASFDRTCFTIINNGDFSGSFWCIKTYFHVVKSLMEIGGLYYCLASYAGVRKFESRRIRHKYQRVTTLLSCNPFFVMSYLCACLGDFLIKFILGSCVYFALSIQEQLWRNKAQSIHILTDVFFTFLLVFWLPSASTLSGPVNFLLCRITRNTFFFLTLFQVLTTQFSTGNSIIH